MFFKKRIPIICFCCICLLALLFLDGGTALANKKRIGVVSFENHTNYKEAGSGVADLFVVELVKNKNFQVIERSRLNKVLQEQGIGLTGVIDDASAAKVGRILGLDYLVFGSITSITVNHKNILGIITVKTAASLSMKMVDATTGSIVLAETARGSKTDTSIKSSTGGGAIWDEKGNDAIVSAVTEAVTKLVDRINETNPLDGVVVSVSGNTVYIDIGREHGVNVGQRYEVFMEGKAITHPVTGKIIGVEKNKIGEIKITGVESGMSFGQAQGGVITVGNKVRKLK